MDVRMPVMDGIEATAHLVTGPSAARVLILTTFDLDDYVYAALRAGASGFMLKDAPAEQLIDAVRVVAAGDALLAPSVTRLLIEEVAAATRRSTRTVAPGLADLTERELEVLRLMARGLSNAEIADALFLGEATVKTHVGRILTKLDLRDRVQVVVVAYESGLVTPGDAGLTARRGISHSVDGNPRKCGCALSHAPEYNGGMTTPNTLVAAAGADQAVQDLRQGDSEVRALDGVTVRSRPAVHRDHGPLGLGQEHAHALPGRPRLAHLRRRVHRPHLPRRRSTTSSSPSCAARGGLHLPGVQPGAHAHRDREHHAAAAARRQQGRPAVDRP
jgi:DNA-binding NarL/FixJ family response regulator